DGRMFYIRLTEKGQTIARAEEKALMQLIEKMTDSLDEREMDVLISILRKVR
ncbi:MAG: MarR family transcriptional regulator, partial [Methanolobus sp. T82-4]